MTSFIVLPDATTFDLSAVKATHFFAYCKRILSFIRYLLYYNAEQVVKKNPALIVTIVVIEKEKDELLKYCERLEKETGKGKFKWGKASEKPRLDYLRRVFESKYATGALCYSIFHNTRDYDLATIHGIAKAVIHRKPIQKFTTSIYVDGLSKSKRHEYSRELRKLGIPTHKVQGVTKDENNALTRLADAIAGFIRDIHDGEKGEAGKLFHYATQNGLLIEV